MPKGRAVIIGVGKVDPKKYNVELRDLPTSERDAQCMLDIASKAKFDVDIQPLLTERATQKAVLDAIAAAVEVSRPGDLFFLGYSGHGRQFKDFSGDEDDHKDETWCLFDGAMTDDVIGNALSKFDPGVRILVTCDSCHSGTILDKMKGFVAAAKKMLVSAAVALKIMTPTSGVLDSRPIILLSSSREDQESATITTNANSAFTTALLEVWSEGTFQHSYVEFHKAIKLRVKDKAQTPQMTVTKAAESAFVSQRPFSIEG